jgi:hypothetical protein
VVEGTTPSHEACNGRATSTFVSRSARLRLRFGPPTYYGHPALGGTAPWRQMVLLTLAAAVFLSSNPQAAYADTPEYDPVFYYYHPGTGCS